MQPSNNIIHNPLKYPYQVIYSYFKADYTIIAMLKKFINFFVNYKIHISILFIFALTLWGLNNMTHKRITAEFTELAPFSRNMPVYYKGFKVGKSVSIKPNKNYTATRIKLVLYPADLVLPANIVARVKKRDKEFDYIEIEYPTSPAIRKLRSGDIIEGKTSIDFKDILQQQADSGALDEVGDKLSDVLDSVKETSDALTGLFEILQETVAQNQKNLETTTSNLAQMSKNINRLTYKVYDAMTEKQLKNISNRLSLTSNHLERTTRNLENITKNINDSTQSLNSTMNGINTSVQNVSGITCDVRKITYGLSNTMQKNFSGFRLLFGKAISSK